MASINIMLATQDLEQLHRSSHEHQLEEYHRIAGLSNIKERLAYQECPRSVVLPTIQLVLSGVFESYPRRREIATEATLEALESVLALLLWPQELQNIGDLLGDGTEVEMIHWQGKRMTTPNAALQFEKSQAQETSSRCLLSSF